MRRKVSGFALANLDERTVGTIVCEVKEIVWESALAKILRESTQSMR